MRKTKIICTIGPASESPEVLEKLMKEGMNVARLNFSHGNYEEHKAKMDTIKKLREKLDIPVATLLDTKGPEIRICNFKDKKVNLKKGQKFTLTPRDVEGDETIVSITYKKLASDLKCGDTILIDDGLVELTVDSIKNGDIICTVENSGPISDKKGVNLPGVSVKMPFMSEKDRKDIIFGIENDVDYIAASFTRCADDIKQMKWLLSEHGGEDIKVIAKIENHEGINNIDEITEVADGIMVARGDMGVELPLEEVPILQKHIISKVCNAGKPVIIATQMLDSMMNNPRPTRAETADVANAIYDGTSAIMLSGETASGKFPIKAVKVMHMIAEKTEHDINYVKRFFGTDREANPDVTDAICHATCTTALDLNAKAIVSVTESGRSARMVSKYKPACMIIGCTTSEKAYRQLSLNWGVTPIMVEEKDDVLELFNYAIDEAKKCGLVESGDVTVMTSGVPIGVSGTTNMLKVQIV
ncbi:MAG: pyruvate kinase [Lachnospiraceae bacterium]|nr:pyruvate kinase [Lachnospiraceae bacterium]